MCIHICEQCKNEHDGTYGTGRFCSESCKQAFVSGHSNHVLECKFCGRVFSSPTALGGHIVACKMDPEYEIRRSNVRRRLREHLERANPMREHVIKCQACGEDFIIKVRDSQFAKGDYKRCCSIECAHHREVTEEQKRKASQTAKINFEKRIAMHDASIKNIRICTCISCRKDFLSFPMRMKGFNHSSRYCSEECACAGRAIQSSYYAKLRCDKGEFGGINNDTYKKHKRGWYKGIFCGSSWELAFVMYSLDNGLHIKRCSKVLEYEYDGKILKYYPDFEIDGTIYEIKGFESGKAKRKHETFPEIVYIDRTKIIPYLEYAKQTYGKDFTRMLCEKKI